MYIQAVTMKGLDKKLRVAAIEAMEYGCTWSISKFFAGRPCNIVSRFRVLLDLYGINPPHIGPDPEINFAKDLYFQLQVIKHNWCGEGNYLF